MSMPRFSPEQSAYLQQIGELAARVHGDPEQWVASPEPFMIHCVLCDQDARKEDTAYGGHNRKEEDSDSTE